MTADTLTCLLRAARPWCATVLLGALIAFVGGCGPTQKERAQLRHFPKAYQQKVSTDRYAVNPPDVITINAPLAPEVDKVKQVVSPDGTLNLDLLGRVYVAGMSPREVEDLLTEKLKTYYKDAKVRVDVEQRSQFFYVFGEANRPGPKAYTGRDTLVHVLADAQPTRLAWPERVYVLRPSPDPEQRHVTVINMYEMVKNGDTTANVLLQQDDIVYIPLNPLAAVGVALQNVLFPVQPVFNTAGGLRALGG